MAVAAAKQSNPYVQFPEEPSRPEGERLVRARGGCADPQRALQDKASRDHLACVAATENDGKRSGAGKMAEGVIGRELEGMAPGSKVSVELSNQFWGGKLGVPVTARAKFQAEVARQDDGSYLATVSSGAGVGGALREKIGSISAGAEQTFNGEVSATYRFGSKEEAADKLAALAQATAVEAASAKYGPAARWAAAAVTDPDVSSRVESLMRDNCKSVEASVFLNVEGSANVSLARGSLAVSPKATMKVDFDAKTVTFDRKGSVEQKAGVGARSEGPVFLAAGSNLLAEKLNASVTVRDTYRLSGDEDLAAALKKAAAAPDKRELIVKASGQASNLSFEAERKVSLEDLGSLQELADLGETEVRVKVLKPTRELGAGAELGPLRGVAKVTREDPVGGQGFTMKVKDIPERLEKLAGEIDGEQALLSARRAIGR